MDAFFISTLVVAAAEIGDKTQLLALVLAARFRRPWPIIWGILIATLANHGLAALAGSWVSHLVPADWLRWMVGLSFIAMAGWILVPDKVDEDEGRANRHGAFLTTLVSFFLVEIGDKTQIATVALAARFNSIWVVAAGTTLGMMLANVPAVYLGEVAAKRIPLKLVRAVAAAIFTLLGLMALFNLGLEALGLGKP